MTYCRCQCHRSARAFWRPYPDVTDPVEALAACDLCEPLHRGVWSLYKRPRITRKWKDADGGTS